MITFEKWALIASLAMLTAPLARAEKYYVSASGGNDDNNGTSETSAWKTIAKINDQTFHPGDSILFKSGETWKGQLNPKGSGSVGKPIIIDKYGTGASPAIDGEGATGNGTVYLFNQEYWEIRNLDLTDDAPNKGDRRGVFLAAASSGGPTGKVYHHLVVGNCHIHNIKGIIGEPAICKRTGGVIVEMQIDGPNQARFDDILIENCTISTVDNEGIAFNSATFGESKEPGQVNANITMEGGKSMGYPGSPEWEALKFTHVVIRNNKINDISKNAMIIRYTDETGLIEHNVCWDTAVRFAHGNTIYAETCRGTVFQYNEGYRNRATQNDGSLYDADIASPGFVFQYSYSHDNSHGLYWQCTDPRDKGIVVRYNISQNDKGPIFCIGHPSVSTYIYNNTVYVSAERSPEIIAEHKKSKPNTSRTYYFYNNIIYNLSPKARYQWSDATRTFDSNVFFGIHAKGEPEDEHKLTSDPLLVAPGTGKIGIDTLDGYKLKAGSPCIHSARSIPDNGGLDFWDHVVSDASGLDRGAGQWLPVKP